jgi:hypothetical protein
VVQVVTQSPEFKSQSHQKKKKKKKEEEEKKKPQCQEEKDTEIGRFSFPLQCWGWNPGSHVC